MSDPPATNPTPRHLPALDGVRGVAVMMVVLYHAVFTVPGGQWVGLANLLLGVLWVGVELFFVLSGYLITRILLATRDRPRYFTSFYARRTLRIFPLYYGVLVGFFVVLPVAEHLLGGPFTRAVQSENYQTLWGNQAYLWTYTQNFLQSQGPSKLPGFGHCWSLAIEEQFYLLWPLVVWLLGGRRLGAACIAIGVVTPLLRYWLLQQGEDSWALYHYTYTRWDSLVWGALVAVIETNPDWMARARRAAPVAALVSFLAAAWCFSFAGQTESITMSMFEPQVQVAGYTFIALCFMSLILRLASDEPDEGPALLKSPVLRTIGKYSYAVYVFHWPVERALEASGLTAPHESFITIGVRFVIVFAVSFALALLSWHLWEKQWLKLKKRFPY